MSITGGSRACNEVRGHFDINRITYERGTVDGFDATFEQWCDDASSPLRGHLQHFVSIHDPVANLFTFHATKSHQTIIVN